MHHALRGISPGKTAFSMSRQVRRQAYNLRRCAVRGSHLSRLRKGFAPCISASRRHPWAGFAFLPQRKLVYGDLSLANHAQTHYYYLNIINGAGNDRGDRRALPYAFAGRQRIFSTHSTTTTGLRGDDGHAQHTNRSRVRQKTGPARDIEPVSPARGDAPRTFHDRTSRRPGLG